MGLHFETAISDSAAMIARGRVAVTALVVALVVPSAASAADPALVVVGVPDTPRNVDLRLQGGPPRVMTGALRLALRNAGTKSFKLRLRYAPADGRPLQTITNRSKVVRLSGVGASRPKSSEALTMKPGATRDIGLRFELPANELPDILNGDLILQAFQSGAPGVKEQQTVAVHGRPRPVGDVRVEPAKAVLQVDRVCVWFDCPGTEGGAVRLVGTGVAALLDDLSATGDADRWAEVARGDGETSRVFLRNLEVTSDPQVATAQLELGDDPPPGAFAGKLPLSLFDAKSPAVAAEVRSHLWVGWALIAVLVGVVLAWMLLHHLALRQRRLLIQRWLQARAKEYADHSPANRLDDGSALLAELEVQWPLTIDPSWTYADDLGTARRIFTAARWARNDADLDEAQAAAGKLSVQINTWLLAVLQARELWDLDARPQQSRVTRSWEETQTAIQTRALLHQLRGTPIDEQTLEAVERQVIWHRAYAQAWDLRLRLESADPDGVRDIPFDAIDDELQPTLARTPEQQAVLEVKLTRSFVRMRRLADQTPQVDTPEQPLTLSPGAEVVAAKRNVEAARVFAKAPELAVTQAAQNRPGTPVLLHDVPRNDAAGQQEEAGAAAMGERPTSSQPRAPQLRRGARALRRLQFVDFLQTLVILTLASLAYFFAIYDDTWGSVADVATALLAGFAGQVTVQWALLPIYRSVRLRSEAATEGAAVAGGAPS